MELTGTGGAATRLPSGLVRRSTEGRIAPSMRPESLLTLAPVVSSAALPVIGFPLQVAFKTVTVCAGFHSPLCTFRSVCDRRRDAEPGLQGRDKTVGEQASPSRLKECRRVPQQESPCNLEAPVGWNPPIVDDRKSRGAGGDE